MIQTRVTVDTTLSQEFYQEACEYTPKGAPCGKWWEPNLLYIQKAQGCRIVDLDGNEYIDYHCGAGPVILGHAHPEVNQAVIDTLQERGVQYAMPHPLEIELAKKLRECMPSAEKSSFCNAGTDAIAFAVRIARAYTGRPKIVKFEGVYQGWYDSVVMSSAPSRDMAGPASYPNTVVESAGILPEVVANTIVLPYNNLDTTTETVEKHKNEIACVIVEPMVHINNIMPKPGFLRGLRQLCDACDILLIFDEIVTGFRHGLGGMQKIAGVSPDVSAFGKAMGNGFPIAAVSGKGEYMDTLFPAGPAFFSGTFNGNPMVSTAALKTIEILGRPGFYERLYGLGETMRSEINRIIERLGIRARCDGYGSVWCLYFSDKAPENYRDVMECLETGGAEKTQAYRDHMLNSGIFIYPPPKVNRAYLNAAHTEAEVQQTIDATEVFLKEHQGELR